MHVTFGESAFSALSHVPSSFDGELSEYSTFGLESDTTDKNFAKPEVDILDSGGVVSIDDGGDSLRNINQESSLDDAASHFDSAVEPV